MPNKAFDSALHQLRIQHNTLGKMLGELEGVRDQEGIDLVNATNDIFHRYGYDLS